MKKLLPVLMLLVLAWGCNKESIYRENLNGTWEVYKYLLNNVERTAQFAASHPAYTITFTEDGKFTETVVNPDTTTSMGTYTFIANDEKIRLINTVITYSYVTDTLGNVDTVSTSKDYKRDYTIFNLTRDHVQLRNDTSQLYMRKPEVEQ